VHGRCAAGAAGDAAAGAAGEASGGLGGTADAGGAWVYVWGCVLFGWGVSSHLPVRVCLVAVCICVHLLDACTAMIWLCCVCSTASRCAGCFPSDDPPAMVHATPSLATSTLCPLSLPTQTLTRLHAGLCYPALFHTHSHRQRHCPSWTIQQCWPGGSSRRHRQQRPRHSCCSCSSAGLTAC
jgi:hypothetical protein